MNESEWQTRQQRIDTGLRSLSPLGKIIRHRERIDLSALHFHAVRHADPHSHRHDLDRPICVVRSHAEECDAWQKRCLEWLGERRVLKSSH